MQVPCSGSNSTATADSISLSTPLRGAPVWKGTRCATALNPLRWLADSVENTISASSSSSSSSLASLRRSAESSRRPHTRSRAASRRSTSLRSRCADCTTSTSLCTPRCPRW